MTHTQNGTIAIDNGTLYYEIAGQHNDKTLVLSHAAFLDSRMFDAQWDVLAEQFRVIRYDMRGYGHSGTVDKPVCRRDDLHELLQHLDIKQAHFVGCSNGGTLMLDFALEHLEVVQSLTMVGSTPSGFEPQGEPPRYMMEMFGAVQQGDVDTASELQIRIYVDGSFREPDSVNQALREKALMMNRIFVERNTFLIADMQPARPLSPAALERLDEIQCPVLLITGALDHPAILQANISMAEQLSDAQHITMNNTAHVPSYECPAAFNTHLLNFLNTL